MAHKNAVSPDEWITGYGSTTELMVVVHLAEPMFSAYLKDTGNAANPVAVGFVPRLSSMAEEQKWLPQIFAQSGNFIRNTKARFKA